MSSKCFSHMLELAFPHIRDFLDEICTNPAITVWDVQELMADLLRVIESQKNEVCLTNSFVNKGHCNIQFQISTRDRNEVLLKSQKMLRMR